MKQTLAEFVRAAAEQEIAAGRSLNQVAAAGSISPGQLSRFLRGQRDLTLTTASRLLEGLGICFRIQRSRRKKGSECG